MRILNMTHSEFWFPHHFNTLGQLVGFTGETFFKSMHLTAEAADAVWRDFSYYFNSFDAVFVSHLSYWCRVFLQNNWTKPLYIWLNYKFDYGLGGQDLAAYHQLIQEARFRPNVKFFAASEMNKRYAQSVLGDFPMEIVPPIFCIQDEGRVEVPQDRLFLWSKHNETLFNWDGISVYKHNYAAGPPNLREALGIVHIPYVCDTRSFWENMALDNIYFLPTEDFLRQHLGAPSFFWDSYGAGDIEHSMWYGAHKPYFVYFSSLEELKEIASRPDLKDLVAEKKKALHEFNQRYYRATLNKWQGVFNG